MKRLITLLLASLLLSGCATVTIDTTKKDGTLCKATAYSLFVSLNDVGLSACGGKTSAHAMTGDSASIDAVASMAGQILGAAVKKTATP